MPRSRSTHLPVSLSSEFSSLRLGDNRRLVRIRRPNGTCEKHGLPRFLRPRLVLATLKVDWSRPTSASSVPLVLLPRGYDRVGLRGDSRRPLRIVVIVAELSTRGVTFPCELVSIDSSRRITCWLHTCRILNAQRCGPERLRRGPKCLRPRNETVALHVCACFHRGSKRGGEVVGRRHPVRRRRRQHWGRRSRCLPGRQGLTLLHVSPHRGLHGRCRIPAQRGVTPTPRT
mmetsp:Transcript_23713/g.60626  ORF Transcript_23713/g.60626 Transcript_23713/m.60626 type:complete len:230 (+) Transcript_23713:225-914(+)